MSGKKAAAPAAGKAKGGKALTAKGKAAAAAKAARIGTRHKNVVKRTKVHFYRPHTVTLARTPKYARTLPRAVAKKDKFRWVARTRCAYRGWRGMHFCRVGSRVGCKVGRWCTSCGRHWGAAAAGQKRGPVPCVCQCTREHSSYRAEQGSV